jgi:hypothetical protein
MDIIGIYCQAAETRIGSYSADAIPNSWYYFFSTISQALAASTALLAALAINQLNFLTIRIINLKERISEGMTFIGCDEVYNKTASPFADDANWNSFALACTEIIEANSKRFDSNVYPKSKNYMTDAVNRIQQTAGTHRRIRTIMIATGVISGALILLSIIAIPFAGLINLAHLTLWWIAASAALTILTCLQILLLLILLRKIQ